MGKQIRIYLADGSASGIRHAEITNWSGQALACPRSRFVELRDWEEVKRPGAYLLFGTNEDTGEDAVYIGESEVVLDRLQAHISGKEFWAELIAFTNKDDNLTKAHVKYLESRLIQLATEAKRYSVTNSSLPQAPSLPKGDRDAMDEYLQSARILLGVLGHRVLEPFVDVVRVSSDMAPNRASQKVGSDGDADASVGALPTFNLRTSDVSAKATRTDEGIVVLAGSQATLNVQSSLSSGLRVLRDKLINANVLSHENGKLFFTRDQLFNSPSQAAAIVVGYSINGRDAWRLDDGTTYARYEDQATRPVMDDLSNAAK